jgi:hypothetical protein
LLESNPYPFSHQRLVRGEEARKRCRNDTGFCGGNALSGEKVPLICPLNVESTPV